MANEYIDKINTINTAGTSAEYDIIATSGAEHAYYVDKATTVVSSDLALTASAVGSAKGINSTYKITLGNHVTGDDLIGTAISANKTINTRIKTTPWSAINKTDNSGSKSTVTSGTADSTWSSTNTRFLTPDVVKGYVDKKTSALAEEVGLYQVKGNSTFANLTNATAHHNGFVYNITDGGTIPTTSGYNGQTFEVVAGDNLVYLTGGTQEGWDKLGDIFAEARSTLKPYSAASGDMNNFNSTYNTITGNNGSATWNNSAHNVFSTVKTKNGNINAGAYNSTLNLSGLIGVSAGGNTSTATFGLSGAALSGFKTFKVTKRDGTTANINATQWADEIKFTAGSKITLSPTTDASGNPMITINKTDTSASKATSASLGMVQKSYYKEVDTTNHIGTLVVQGNMSSTTFNTP